MGNGQLKILNKHTMIDAIIFDLDGTLVKTERLKALSYAKAAVELCPHSISENEVIEGFREVVGRSRKEVASYLVEKYNLVEKASARMTEFGVSTPWQAFVMVRLGYYEQMLADPDVILNNTWDHNVAVFEQARTIGCKVGLATMSRCKQAMRILDILQMRDRFDFIATRDDVEHGKPDPEIYNLVLGEFNARPEQTLAIEDSPSGVQAAVNAGVGVIAVGTPFTTDHLLEADFIDNKWVVSDPADLPTVLAEKIKEMNG